MPLTTLNLVIEDSVAGNEDKYKDFHPKNLNFDAVSLLFTML